MLNFLWYTIAQRNVQAIFFPSIVSETTTHETTTGPRSATTYAGLCASKSITILLTFTCRTVLSVRVSYTHQ